MKVYIGIVVFVMIMTGLYTYYHGKGRVSPVASPSASVNVSVTPLQTSSVGNSVGSNAPEFRLQSYTGVSTGIADFRGVEGIVLYFWNVTCSTCTNDLSTLVQLQGQHQNGFLPMAINRADPSDSAREFSDRAGSTSRFPHLLDPNDSVYSLYGGSGMPYYVFIDKNGIIQAIENGAVSQEIIEQDLQKIL
ncbi:MAG: hypothetical protein A3A33_04635 [Candidatus Yanofskybacteria bacterium RIFCSPLOWO2_01_FULL_49_25]|uniref:Thioredoxin domain-containing protein n=1 Tax=Candidatus Yanofskybacteria bacterium RIFCSPLOWO2_01_FULL_49_25 TaxID=1802701 RepID=A0A1F8GR97_9BACT|nr:MAG: hypothetical protein A3A33_04635 [Candidatus Yanofskybacteria bacterium RIFCSPLOWO2_01_FULL_49_25]